MRVRLMAVASVLVLFAGCSADPGGPATTSPDSPTVSTGFATTTDAATSTVAPSITIAPADPLRYFRFDQSGLYLVDGGEETRLTPDPVSTASHDGMGGVLYTAFGEGWGNGLHWTTPGESKPETLNYLGGWGAVLDSRSTAVVDGGISSDPCPETEYRVHLVDLLTGAERSLGCFGGEDGSIAVTSGGGGLLVGLSWLAVGSNGTSHRIHFYDTSGAEIDHPANPVQESCAPCELSVHLSPDGSRLAYQLRPDAKWSLDLEELQRLDSLTHEEWWETSKDIPSVVTVLDLASGQDRFSLAVPAGERLTDFDGRHLVVESCEFLPVGDGEFEPGCTSRIIDSGRAIPDVSVAGGVRLATDVCCRPPTADVFPPLLRIWQPSEGEVTGTKAYRFQGIADPSADVVAAGRYPVTVAPHGSWSIVLVLNPGGNLATITATDDAGNITTVRRTVTYTPTLELHEDGLSVARFGDPADEVIATVTDLLGSADEVRLEGGSDCYLSVAATKFVTWDGAGLRLVFTDWGGTDLEPKATLLHFTDWEVIGPGVQTDTGLSWGSTVGVLRAVYPDVRIGINEFAPMFFAPIATGWMMGGFDWPYEDFMSALQKALNEHGADLETTGDWAGGTTQALFDFMESQGMEDAGSVLGALGLPPDEVRLGWIHAGRGPLCD